MSVAVANARMTVPAPVRKARRFGLLSVAEVVDGGSPHWMLGGLQADGEECSKPLSGEIVCGPTDAKVSRSWYSEITGDPWFTYMYETCKTVGRYSESQEKLRQRFLAVEQSAVEKGFQTNILTQGQPISDTATSVAHGIGLLEELAAQEYGGQIILHLPFVVAEIASSEGVFERVDGHLETVAGNLVSIGNYLTSEDGGAVDTPVLYATGATVLYRSDLILPDPTFVQTSNDYFTLVERAYAGLVDCFNYHITAPVCACADGGTPN